MSSPVRQLLMQEEINALREEVARLTAQADADLAAMRDAVNMIDNARGNVYVGGAALQPTGSGGARGVLTDRIRERSVIPGWPVEQDPDTAAAEAEHAERHAAAHAAQMRPRESED